MAVDRTPDAAPEPVKIYRPRGVAPEDWEELILLAQDYHSHAFLAADPRVNADPGRVAIVLAEACVRVLLPSGGSSSP